MARTSRRACGKLASTVLFTVLCTIAYCETNTNYEQYKNVGGSAEVRHEMDSLVDGVKQAVRDAEKVRGHHEVLDLGQSLHLLEHKFAGLKAAIAHEMGTKLSNSESHSEAAKGMIESTSKLLEDVAGYRQDMQKLLVSVRDIDDSIRAIKSGMGTFDKEVQDMNRLLADLHISTNELYENHQSSNVALDESAQHLDETRGKNKGGKSHKWYFLVLLIEVAGVAFFVYTKRNNMPSAKHYGKFG